MDPGGRGSFLSLLAAAAAATAVDDDKALSRMQTIRHRRRRRDASGKRGKDMMIAGLMPDFIYIVGPALVNHHRQLLPYRIEREWRRLIVLGMRWRSLYISIYDSGRND